MKPNAIVYTSNTGHTETYARLLGMKIGLPVYSLDLAKKQLAKGTPIIYLGWIFASHVKGYKKAATRFNVKALCAVGLCETGTYISEIRKAERLPQALPLYTVQGGIDKQNLKGVNKMIINMLTKSLASSKSRTESDERMLILLKNGGSYVSENNLFELIAWYDQCK